MEDNTQVPSKGDNLLQEHPLLNSVVLKQVFQYLQPTATLDTLKTIRQVCTVWRDESLHWWRTTGVLKLTPDPGMSALIQPPYMVTTFNQLMGNLQSAYKFEEKPFQQYKLKGTTIDIKYGAFFWSFVGVHVQHLILDHVTLTFIKDRVNCREDLIQFLVRFFPNLKTLTVDDIEFQERKEWDFELSTSLERPLPLTPVLSGVVALKIDKCKYFTLEDFPNLKNLTLKNVSWLDSSKTVENSSVTTLNVNCTGSGGVSQNSLKVKLLALQNLIVRGRAPGPALISSYFPLLLSLYGSTLKTLEVHDWPFCLHQSRFPWKCQLTQLTELRLWGNVVKDLRFLKWTPKLKVLQWDLYCLEKQEELRDGYDVERFYTRPIRCDIVEKAMSRGKMDQVVLPDLDHLQINCGFGINSLKKLGEWMPNVKTLKIVLRPGSISVIGEQWPLLEHLVGLHGSTIRDADVVGGEAKSLLDLQLLKTFHLHCACNQGLLTDAVVDSVFLEMRNLKDLQLSISAQFSRDAEVRLENRIPKVRLIRNYAENTEHVNWECCKNTEFMQFLQDNAHLNHDDHEESDSDESLDEANDDDDDNATEDEDVEQQE